MLYHDDKKKNCFRKIKTNYKKESNLLDLLNVVVLN